MTVHQLQTPVKLQNSEEKYFGFKRAKQGYLFTTIMLTDCSWAVPFDHLLNVS